MNAPLSHQLPADTLEAMQQASLDDKYTLSHGQAFMSGVQALVRLPMLQQQRDLSQGQRTGGFVSGYRGSPLGGYDQALHAARDHLAKHDVVFQPGVNEELAATAVWGTQQLGFAPPASRRLDGVFGLWYGKGPGVDRCSDVFKHGNMAGTTPWGGVLALAGDDHVAKSSTAAHQSDHIFVACHMPVFFPASVQDVLDLGVHALALSRYAGVWTGMKTIQEIIESGACVDVDPARVRVVRPEGALPAEGVHIRWPDPALAQEERLFNVKWPAALAYMRANPLNVNIWSGANDRLGIVASGKAFNDVRQALADLGLDAQTCGRIGLRLHKVAVVWPLEPEGVATFAKGLQEVLVVEEKRPLIESQLRDLLYALPDSQRPQVLGKQDHQGHTLLRAHADLNAAMVARALAARLLALDLPADVVAGIRAHLAVLDASDATMTQLATQPTEDRVPWFCSGCPHNTSTRVPEGSRAMAGIGCHFMSVWMDRRTVGFTQMGGEGVPWVGQAPFCHDRHMFANIGDGTYFHSGLLAIRQSIAAGVNITYKILYNDAVAMTGGQAIGERPEGHSVAQIAQSVLAEGAQQVRVVTDEPHKYPAGLLPGQAKVHHRDDLDDVQRQLREVLGTTVIIYDQTCATEKRRRRKRGKMVDPAKRVFINPEVCEGCGDCSVQSNCMSVEPLETPLGRKRTINQNTCNKDTSCLKGFCPSFVTVEGGQYVGAQTAAAPGAARQAPTDDLPWPELPGLQQPWGMLVAGVGGTGVITIGQLLGVAAHLEGKGVVTQDSAGLAQKGGATWAHAVIAAQQAQLHSTRVDVAAAHVVLGCDPIVAAGKETLLRVRPGQTRVVLNSHATPTAGFVQHTEWQNPAQACAARVIQTVGEASLAAFDAHRVATQMLGDSIYINPMVLGFAWQKGWVPLHLQSLRRAIELNGVAVANNLRAFDWGRRCAHDWPGVQAMLQPAQMVQWHVKPSLNELVADRVQRLTQYQNQALAARYQALVQRVRQAEQAVAGEGAGLPLAETVARQYFRALAIKDEYEVARLYTRGDFMRGIQAQFQGDAKVFFHLAPPLLAGRDARGLPTKRRLGRWLLGGMHVLAALRGVRGSVLDVFGYHPERRAERAWLAEYEAALTQLVATLDAPRHPLAVQIAQVGEQVRGYGHVKMNNLKAARQTLADLQGRWAGDGPAATPPSVAVPSGPSAAVPGGSGVA